MREVDVVVIGAGPAGEVCAGRLGEAGLEVVIVERELVGGECSYWGCMPSKALLRPAQLLAEVGRVPGAREAIAGGVDVGAALRRRDEVVHDLDDDVQLPWLEERHVELVRGHARLAGERLVEVDGVPLRARRAVVVAVGTSAALPPVPGLADVEPWTNRQITTAQQAPGRLVVLGGGPIGVEMAQAWSSLGSVVTLVEAGKRLLPREEPFASRLVAAALERSGVDVRLAARATSVGRDRGEVAVAFADGTVIAADELVVTIGRSPRTEDLGLGVVGLEPGGWIPVDADLRVGGLDWLYAVGDVNARSLLTHSGKHQAAVAADRILGGARSLEGPVEGALAPRVVFTDPQVAAVGHTVDSALAAGLRVATLEASPSANAGASFHGRNTEGLARLVVDVETERIVGATFVGFEVAELLHAATVAIVGDVPLSRLELAVPAFPTRSEVWLRLLDRYADRLATGERLAGALA